MIANEEPAQISTISRYPECGAVGHLIYQGPMAKTRSYKSVQVALQQDSGIFAKFGQARNLCQ